MDDGEGLEHRVSLIFSHWLRSCILPLTPASCLACLSDGRLFLRLALASTMGVYDGSGRSSSCGRNGFRLKRAQDSDM